MKQKQILSRGRRKGKSFSSDFRGSCQLYGISKKKQRTSVMKCDLKVFSLAKIALPGLFLGSTRHTNLKCFFIHAECPGNGGCWWKQIPKMDGQGAFPIQLGTHINLLLLWELPHLQVTKSHSQIQIIFTVLLPRSASYSLIQMLFK